MDFCHLREIYLNMEKKLMNTDTKTGLDALKTASKQVFHKAAEIAEDIRNKIAHKTVKPKTKSDENPKCRRNSYSTRDQKTRNIKIIKTSIMRQNISKFIIKVIQWFNCVKVCDKKMD